MADESLSQKYCDNIEDTTRDAIDAIEYWGREALISGKIPTERRAAFETSLRGFRGGFVEFARLVEPLRENNPIELRSIYQSYFVQIRSLAALLTEGVASSAGARKAFGEIFAKERSRKAALRSAEVRLEKLAAELNLAEPFLREQRLGFPKWTQDDVAREARKCWKQIGGPDAGEPPGLKALVGRVSKIDREVSVSK